MSDIADNYYVRLGVSRDATQGEIRRAYREAARKMHPDQNPHTRAPELFLRIQEAYEVLSDPARRESYDSTLPEEDTVDSPVRLSTVYSRSMLARIEEPQLIYVLMELLSNPKVATPENPTLNVSLVLDRSTSMQGMRMDTLKSAARELIRQFRTQDYLSIIAFSDRAEVLVPATRGSDIDKVGSRISLLQAGGGTEIFNGLKEGYFEVTRNLNSSFVNHLVLITDGRTYGDEEACLDLATRAQEDGVTFSALGIGTEWNDAFLDELTSKTGGSTVYVASAEDIQGFLEDKFQGLGEVYAEGVQMTFEKDPGVELKYAFRLEPDAGPLALASPLSLGDVPREGKLSVLLELLVSSVPSDSKVVSLVRGDLTMDLPNRVIPKTRLHVNLERPTSQAIDPEPPPQRIVKAMSRLTLYRMQEKAKEDLAQGNIEEATRRLQNLATHLLAQGERELARTVMAEADRVAQGHSISEQGEKRIKYGTRALLLPPNLEDTLP